MIFHPSILALNLSALLTGFLILYSAYYGLRIQRAWDIRSGSELQLRLERRTYLISTMLSYLFACELLSFFYFIYTADQLHSLFVGAMCAAGTLKVNTFGYPALILKTLNFLLAGLWLILNHLDNRAYDYPLTRTKYRLLLLIAPLILAEIYLQTRYFSGLRPDIITSCCSVLFNPGNTTLTGDLANLPPLPAGILFYGGLTATAACGVVCWRSNRAGRLLGGLSGLQFIISVAAMLSFISPYFYELPTHHCPFCVLQKEYGYIGYPLYASLFGAAVTGTGAGLLDFFRRSESLGVLLPALQKKLALASMVLWLCFGGIVSLRILASNLVL